MTQEKMRCFTHIAKLIKERRVSHPKKYSQSELSQLLGYKNGQFISNVERALCNIPLKMLPKVTDILDIPSQDLKDAMLADHRETLDNFLRQVQGTDGEREAAVSENPAPTTISPNSATVVAARTRYGTEA